MRIFTVKTFEFFMAIRGNNNADFFHANHDWYAESVRGPFLDLAAYLAPYIASLDPRLETRPEKCVSRLNRDVRYAKDKSPYRDYLWLSFRAPALEPTGRPGFWFDLSDESSSWGMGMYYDNRPLMNAFRRDVALDPAAFEAALEPVRDMNLRGNAYKRLAIPDGLPENLRAWYPLKSFALSRDVTDWKLLTSETLGEVVLADFKRLAPLYEYMMGLPTED